MVYSLVLLVSFLILWQGIAGAGGKGGKAAGIPGPLAVAETAWVMLSDPFYDRGPNDKGFGLQLGYSLMRMMGGYLCASVVPILLAVALGSPPPLFNAPNPSIHLI